MKTCANVTLDGALFGRASYCSRFLFLYFTVKFPCDGDINTEFETQVDLEKCEHM